MPHRHIRQKVNKLLITMYGLVVLIMFGGLGFAMQQNWALKVQVTQSELARQAGVGNFIVESAIVNATKSLSAAQRAMGNVLNNGPLSALQAHLILQESLNDFNAYSNSSYGGLLLYTDEHGDLIARTDHYPAERLNFSDRFYFKNFLQHPELERSLSPLVQARTTGEWVFHVAVPIKDRAGHFRGALAQQIRAIDIARDLSRYIDTRKTPQLVSQSAAAGMSFVYPVQLLSERGLQGIDTPYADFARRSASPQDTFSWPPSYQDSAYPKVFVGFEHTEQSGLLTTIHLPVADVWLEFLYENLFLLGMAGLALVLVSGLFWHLYGLSNRLTAALYDAYSDTLTQLSNRRAFEDIFPRLLREALRSQEPLSVLFIDIDHFKNFNDDFGHDGGDIALKSVAQTLSRSATRPLDLVCRWGGEEFVVVLPHTSKEAAIALSQKILEAVRTLELKDSRGREMRRVTVSIGIASGTIVSSQLGEHLVFDADEAMQKAKQGGRDQYACYPTPC